MKLVSIKTQGTTLYINPEAVRAVFANPEMIGTTTLIMDGTPPITVSSPVESVLVALGSGSNN